MQPPDQDLADRAPVWDAMQYFWMDTDPAQVLAGAARTCAGSNYSLDELEAIYWNEVRPAVAFNLRAGPAPEWAGFELEWLTQRILAKSRYGRGLPWRWLRPDTAHWWRELRTAVVACRSGAAG
ncbi:hypothetical protein LVB77_08540 [Lysobacter sp. 5GHs7-4]|uniref:DUF7079 family protein n=1 Tax=Lysobacter sp. 5GHs7-4 TaxID=2904253 RepID=UPI001E5F9051|nr:hypothetical protein [Lysobacter sp. 5GHs7-4]UHQ24718.1 hypothetical protein LVB77_08540 [Lysobacter sp. 5GHs7-4]